VVTSLAALAVAGCGGSSGSGEEGKVKDAITTYGTKANPASCTDLATQRFVEQSQYEKGAEALKSCQSDQKTGKLADAIAFSQVTVTGDTAQARFEVSGGDTDGQRLTVALVKTNGQWKLDRTTDVVLDRPKFDKALRAEMTRGSDALPVSQANCVISELTPVVDSTIAQAIVSGDASFIGRPVAQCVFPDALRKEGLNTKQVACVTTRVLGGLSDAEIGAAVVTNDKAAEKKLNDALVKAIKGCPQ
jgi:hypothetical protein